VDGDFTNIASEPTLRQGGHNYTALIRKTAKRPIRVFCRMARTIWTTSTATGRWPTRRWRDR
jgi:enterochelin esterase family protein